jgi:CheY-like chemotaxis protein
MVPRSQSYVSPLNVSDNTLYQCTRVFPSTLETPESLIVETLSGLVMGNAVPVILVADDDDGIRNLVAIFLESSGFTVVRARDGCEALALWTRRRREIDLLITDIEMPEMSGVELIGHLNRSDAGIPILIISGSTSAFDPRNLTGVNGGAIPILAKPFDLRALGQMVADLLHAAPHGATAVS